MDGMSKFLLDCHTNDNISEIEAEFGVKGFAVVVRLWQKIYSEKGYYCEWKERSPLLFLANWFGGNSGVDINLINMVVERCLKNGIFDAQMYGSYSILTSERIQSQYFDYVKRRERVEVEEGYLLISVDKIKGIVYKNGISARKNAKNACRNPTTELNQTEPNISVSKDTDCRIKIRRVVEHWNQLSDCGIKKISRVNAGTKRYDCLVARIKQNGIDDVLKAVDRIRRSSFLQGHNNRGWFITFDWFVLPNNFVKVLEGNYDDAPRATQAAGYSQDVFDRLTNESRGDLNG